MSFSLALATENTAISSEDELNRGEGSAPDQTDG